MMGCHVPRPPWPGSFYGVSRLEGDGQVVEWCQREDGAGLSRRSVQFVHVGSGKGEASSNISQSEDGQPSKPPGKPEGGE